MFVLRQILLICLVSHVTFSAVIDKYAGKICNVKDPGVNECLQKAIQHVFDQSSKGVKEIDLISFNPLQIPKAALSENRGGPTQLELFFTNVKHSHLSESTIKNVSFDVKTGHLAFSLDNPLSIFEGQYKMGGKILALPINGDGDASIRMTNNIMKIQMDLKEKNGKDNKKYVDVSNVKCKIITGKTSFKFDNLFGNKDLSDNMNKFLNENDKEVMGDITLALDAMYDKIVEGIVVRLFASKPAEEIIIL